MFGHICALLLSRRRHTWKSPWGLFCNHCRDVANCIDIFHSAYAALSICLDTVTTLNNFRMYSGRKLSHHSSAPYYGLGWDTFSVGECNGIAVIACHLSVEQYIYPKISEVTLGVLGRFFRQRS